MEKVSHCYPPPKIDPTLTQSGQAADAKTTGDRFSEKLDKQQGVENKGKALIVGEDGNVIPGEVQGGGGDGIAITNTMNGASPLVIPDSAERVNKGIGLTGKTEQVHTSGKNLFDKNSVVNGVIIADGTVTDNAPLYVTSDYIPVKPSVTYACTETGSKRLKFFDADKQTVQNINFEDANVERGGTFTTGETTSFIRLSLLRKKLDSITLNEGSKSIPYEPYTGGKPSPSPEYPQEIKSVGKWNEETQKYEMDIKVTNAKESWDKEQTITLTSDRPITKWDKLVEQDGQIGWLYGTDMTYQNITESRIEANNIGELYGRYYVVDIKGKQYAEAVCNMFPYRKNMENGACGFWWNDTICMLVSSAYTGNDGTEDYNTAINNFKKNVLSKGITVYFQKEIPEFVPLPQSEQDAIRALMTYYPTTVITADGGEVDPDIELTYIADTKNYIDQKLEAIGKSVVATQMALL